MPPFTQASEGVALPGLLPNIIVFFLMILFLFQTKYSPKFGAAGLKARRLFTDQRLTDRFLQEFSRAE